MATEPCKTIQMDTRGVMQSLISYFVSVMEKMEEKTIETMREELQQNGSGPRASSSEIDAWKSLVSSGIQVLYRDIAYDYIESKVGIDNSNKEDEVYRKAIIIALGGGPTHAGPPGQMVWDEHYVGQHPSQAKAEKALPDTWILQPNHWIDNAARKMKVYFYDLLDAGIQALPSVFFYGNTYVT